MRTVLVSGGVISGIGKGIIASSTGLLLKSMGLRVTCIKIDPYLNIDSGTLSPLEHGETFVLGDGGECDLDLGNYERYLGIQLTRDSNITTGKIYQAVLKAERQGKYLGKTVQVVPHITDEIQDHISRVAQTPVDDSGEPPDVCIIELGGTIGDIESMPFVEALVQYGHKLGRGNFFNINVTYVPLIHGEEKSKPTQAFIRSSRSAGLIPDLIACRCEHKIKDVTLQKIARSCQVAYDQVMTVWDLETIYQVPLILKDQGLLDVLTRGLGLDKLSLSPERVQKGARLLEAWESTVMPQPQWKPLRIVLVGKYTALDDSYLSVRKSLEHSAMRCGRKLDLVSVDSEHLEDVAQKNDPTKYHSAWNTVCTAQGVIVPGGFGVRGVDGMMKAATWARERKIPYLGLCLGLQVAVMAYARDVCGIQGATSEEFDANAQHPVIIFMPEGNKEQLGGTMRLGTRSTHFVANSGWSKFRALYKGAEVIYERHRHRYEVNPAYVEQLEKGGLTFVGKDDTGTRMEVIEIKDHPYYVSTQAHPEYTSKVLQPSPPVLGFVAASAGCLDRIIEELRSENGAVDGASNIATF